MQCTHVKADGIRCGSPALRGEAFCYFHFYNADHRPRRDAKVVDIPFPEDAQCIQVGLYNVMQAIVERKIDDKRARLLIWSLQVAATQTRNLRFDSCIHQSNRVTVLPEYERVQRETAKADREYVAKWQAEAGRKESAGEGGDNPTLAARTWGTEEKTHPSLRDGWGTQSESDGDVGIAPSPAGKGAAPEVDKVVGEGEIGPAGEDGGATDAEAGGESVEGIIEEGVMGPAGEGTGATSEGGGAGSVGTGHSPVPTRAAMSHERMDRVIERAVNGDWRSAQKLFREAGLMPLS